MDIVEFHFKDSDKETLRQYEVSTFEEAIQKYHLEFPVDETRPRVFRVVVEHERSKVVQCR